MMMNGFGTGMGFGAGIGMLLVLVLVVLAIAALTKYLCSQGSLGLVLFDFCCDTATSCADTQHQCERRHWQDCRECQAALSGSLCASVAVVT